MPKRNDLRVAGVAAVLTLALSSAAATAALGVEATTDQATTAKATAAKKKCKKKKGAAAAKKKCKRSVRQGGNYTMFVSEGGRGFGFFRYAGAGLFPDPRPIILSPELDGGFLGCTHVRDGSPQTHIETAGYTYPDLKAGTFSYSFPLTGPPEYVRGQIHMQGRWVSPFKIVGFFQAQGLAYERPMDPEQEDTIPGENFTCIDVSTPFVAIANASIR